MATDETTSKAVEVSSPERPPTAAQQRASEHEGTTDTAQLASDIEKTREELAVTIDAIVDKVSPKKVAERTKQQASEAARQGVHDATVIVKEKAATATQVVKEKVPHALLIFLVPPSLEDLFHRLRARATETADELEIRQRNAAIELARQDDYDYVVVNETGQVERTAERIDEIIDGEHARYPDRRVEVYQRSPGG